MAGRSQRFLCPLDPSLSRRHWRFVDTSRGARARVYSLIETAKVNSLESYDYLRDVRTDIATADIVEKLEALLPGMSIGSTPPTGWTRQTWERTDLPVGAVIRIFRLDRECRSPPDRGTSSGANFRKAPCARMRMGLCHVCNRCKTPVRGCLPFQIVPIQMILGFHVPNGRLDSVAALERPGHTASLSRDMHLHVAGRPTAAIASINAGRFEHHTVDLETVQQGLHQRMSVIEITWRTRNIRSRAPFWPIGSRACKGCANCRIASEGRAI